LAIKFDLSGEAMGDEQYDANKASGDPQDLDPRIGFHRRRDRLIAEIIGMFRISLCDGVISQTEARALHDWIRENPDTSFIYPVKQLKERLDRAFADDLLDPDEQRELQEFGKKFQPDVDEHHPAPSATKLPLDDPAPPLAFAGQQFVFTGTFVSGTRKWCEEQVTVRGGVCKSKVVQTMNVLVIGDLATHNWIQSTHGRKIEEVMRLKTSGFRIQVVDEPHFVSHL
jgi:NAD-dependent DNA ligase